MSLLSSRLKHEKHQNIVSRIVISERKIETSVKYKNEGFNKHKNTAVTFVYTISTNDLSPIACAEI